MANLQDVLNNGLSVYNQGSPTKTDKPSQFAADWREALRNAVDTIDKLRKPSLWDRVPKGMPTLAKNTLDENIRAQKANELLAANQLAETIRHNKAAEALSALAARSGGGGGGGGYGSTSSGGLTALQIANLRTKALEMVNNDPAYFNATDQQKQEAALGIFNYFMGVAPLNAGGETYEVSDDAVNNGGTEMGVGFNPATDGIKWFKMPSWWNKTPTPVSEGFGVSDYPAQDNTKETLRNIFLTPKQLPAGTTPGWEYL
jgi:hypothetical protein